MATKLGKMLKPPATLPSRKAMNELAGSERRITDYAKATPLLQSDAEPASILQLMWKPRNDG